MGPTEAILSRLAFFVASVLTVSGCSAGSECDAGGSCIEDSDGATGEDPWPPDTCSLETSPFLQAECLDAMRLACNQRSEENDCTSAPGLSFDGGGYEVRCSWARVVRFSDADTCTVQTVEGRCEASLEGLPCGDLCAGESLVGNISALPSESELVQLCGGPLGAWSAVDSPQMHAFGCGENLEPPAPPLCDCVDVACEAS